MKYNGTINIGETDRTMGLRIKKHRAEEEQTVYKHLESHKIKGFASNDNDITWKMLHSNMKFSDERKCIKAFKI